VTTCIDAECEGVVADPDGVASFMDPLSAICRVVRVFFRVLEAFFNFGTLKMEKSESWERDSLNASESESTPARCRLGMVNARN